jgi:hypothetical protein
VIDQVLPYAILYCSRRSAVPEPSGDRPVLLWVDPHGDERLERWIEANSQVEVRRFKTRPEMWVWMARFEDQLKAIRERRLVRIITNRYDHAGVCVRAVCARE